MDFARERPKKLTRNALLRIHIAAVLPRASLGRASAGLAGFFQAARAAVPEVVHFKPSHIELAPPGARSGRPILFQFPMRSIRVT